MRYATEVEAQETWRIAQRRWDNLAGKLDFPWVEARFVRETFIVSLKQQGFRLPFGMGG